MGKIPVFFMLYGFWGLGQTDAEARAASRRGADGDFAVLYLDVLFGKGEADAGAARGVSALVEFVEDVRQFLGGDAGAVVFDGQAELVWRFFDGKLDVAAVLRMAARVDEQIADDLTHAVFVERQKGELGGDVPPQFLLFFVKQGLHEHGGLAGELAEAAGLFVQAQLVDFGQREVAQVGDEPIEPHDFFLQREEAFGRRLGDAGGHVLKGALQHGERCAQFMRDARKEIAL